MNVSYNKNIQSSFVAALLIAGNEQAEFIHSDLCREWTLEELTNLLPKYETPNVIFNSLCAGISIAVNVSSLFKALDRDFVTETVFIPICRGFYKKYKVPGAVPKNLLTAKDKDIFNIAKELMELGQNL